MTPAEITARLGPATFARLDGPAALWRYQNGFCALEVFLFRDEDGENDALTVHHVSARTDGFEAVPTQACLDALGEIPASS